MVSSDRTTRTLTLRLSQLSNLQMSQMRRPVRAARRAFGIPHFRLYALADGIKQFLFSRSKDLRIDLPPPKARFVQRLLFDP